MSQRHQAVWPVWLNIPLVAPKQAVALSLNLDPRAYPGVEWVLLEDAAEFSDRLFVTASNIGRAAGLVPESGTGPKDYKLSLSGFAYWARSMDWQPLPPEFEELANRYVTPSKDQADTAQAAAPEMSSKGRNYLLRIIRVLEHMANLSSLEPYKAAGVIAKEAASLRIQLGEQAVAQRLQEARDLRD